MNDYQRQLLEQWKQAKKVVAEWKEHELNLRVLVIEQFANPAKPTGGQTVKTELGKLSIQREQKFKMENKNGETQNFNATLSPELQIRLFKWTPDLNKKEFYMLKQMAEAEIAQGQPNGPNAMLVQQIESLLTITNSTAQASFEDATE